MLREKEKMNSLESLMGLNRQGIPAEMAYADDPMLQLAMQSDNEAMMEGMGVPPLENPYELVGMEQPQGGDIGNQLTQQMLGGPVPQLSQPEINALAQSLGIGNQNNDPMTDPMYAQQYNIMSILGGR